jgi:hypothetical protein
MEEKEKQETRDTRTASTTTLCCTEPYSARYERGSVIMGGVSSPVAPRSQTTNREQREERSGTAEIGEERYERERGEK